MSGERTDTVYLDVWEREVDAQEDGNLVNPDIGIETYVRLKREWVVRVAEGITEQELPALPKGHVYYPLASLKRTANQNIIGQEDNTDLRRTGLSILSEEITIKDGNVGIGTRSPASPLHIIGNAGAVNPLATLLIKSTIDHGGVVVDAAASKQAHYRFMENGVLKWQWRAPFHLSDDLRAYNWTLQKDVMTLKNDGRVGIGTTNPGAKLEVVADTGTWNGWYEAIRLGQSAHSAITHPGGGLLFGFHSNRTFYFADTINGNYLVTIEAAEGGILWAKRHTGGGLDYAEYFESKNGKEIKPGTSVVLEDAKIRSAKKNEIPIGVISASPGIVGGVHIEWPKKHLRDEFGQVIMEEYKEEIMVPKKEKIKKERQKMEKKKVKEKVKRTEVVKKKGKYYQVEVEETVERDIEEPAFKEFDLYDDVSKKKIGKHQIPVMETYEEEIDVLDDNGQPMMVGSGKYETKTRPKINPDYDETKEYIPREKRPEWNCVGLLGQLPLLKGQPIAPTWIKIKDISKDVELWLVK